MNIRNCVLKTAFALAAGAFPLLSRAATGNIYEIRPVDADGNAIAAPTANLNPGETARFTVRLMKNELTGSRFGLVYLGVGSEAVAWYANRPKIGIWVSGELRFATLESVKACGEVFTDLIFAYEVKPGDFALPIRLAGSSGSMLTPNSSTSEYYLDFRQATSPDWDICIGGVSGGAQANFWYGTPFSGVSAPESDGRKVDYDLSTCNFNVQTVDFDDAWDDATTPVWRTVHQGSCEIDNGGEIPSLHVDSMPTNNAYSLYLWSSDETKFKMPEGTDCVQRDIHVTSTTTEKRWVREIKIISGKQDYTFDIEGVAQGTTANLVLSPYPDFNYSDGTSAILSDYVTVPVKCSEPSARAVTVAPASRTVTATSDYTHYVTELKVTFNQAFSEDVEIEIVPSIQDTACPFNWWDYIRFSNATDDDVTLQTNPDTNPTVTIRAGSTTATTRLYIYALRSDEWVNNVSNHILFTPKTTNANASQPVADGGIGGWNEVAAAGLNISAQNPSIDSVFDGTDAATAIADVDRTLRIVVTDTYADMTCTDGGYEVWIVKDKDGSDTTPVKVDGLFRPGKDGLLFLADTTSTLPTVRYSAEKSSYTSSIYVVSPISGNQSAYHDFTMTVTAPNRVVPTILSTSETYTGEGEFAEGETVQLKIALQDASGNEVQNSQGDVYVYIKGDDDDATASISCSWMAKDGGKGRKLGAYEKSVSSGCTFELTDGDASKLGKFLSYSIVLLTEPTWTDDASKVVAAYKSNTPVTFNVHNVIPSVDTVSINDTYDVSVSGSTTPVVTFPIDVDQKFSVLVNEPSEPDKTATGDGVFQVRWRFIAADGTTEQEIASGNPDTTSVTHAFDAAGEYTVEVSLADKDMGSSWGNGELKGTFTFKVRVIDQPAITLEHNGPYNETDSIDAGGEAQVTVKLGINECNFPMEVKLLIAPNATGSTAPGLFKLQESANVTANGSETVGGVDYDSYTVTFPRRTLEVPIFVQSMDGTLDSKTTGFKAILENLTTTVVPNSGGKRACDYYLGQSPTAIKVYNVAPVLDETVDVYPVPGTNAFKVAIGQVDEALTWSFTDVANDFDRGITVEFKGGGGYSKTFYSSADAIAAGAEGFKPTFTSSGAGQTVRLVITDPDNGVKTVTWTYDVEAAKSMTLAAHGPATGLGGAKSDRYNSKAKGLGEGRVWAASRSAIPVSTWESTINCQLEKSFRVYGYGYKVGDVDDGATLHYPDGRTGYYTTRDTPINASGANLATGETGYTYVPRKDEFGNSVDSFLYTWLVLSTGDSSGGAVTDAYLNETTAPEYSEANDAGRAVSLPTEEDDEGGYALTQLEAVFSIEKYASDNMGDINLDGIPDIYAKKYDFGVYDASSGAVTGDDLASLASFNDDEDYLPDGTKFTAQLEIRGYGHGLNDAPSKPWIGLTGVKPDLVYTDPDTDSKSTLSQVEYLAWLEYAAANGLSATDPANWSLWSPECPSDPTLEDTDEDGFPDGLEYYYWYRATVGYLDADGNHRYQTGRRFNPKNPGAGTVITSEEIASLMNPGLPSGTADEAAARDSDNDGLTDLEELVLGTDPFDFDTDGDGLPDGFEILVSKTDPLSYSTTKDGVCDAERNFDGDHMAYTTVFSGKDASGAVCLEEQTRSADGTLDAKPVEYYTSFAVLDSNGDTDGLQWYVVKSASLAATTDTPVAEACQSFEALVAGEDGAAAWTKAVVLGTTLPTVADSSGNLFLAKDFGPSAAFLNDGDDANLVRGVPLRLGRGTQVRNVTAAAAYTERRLTTEIKEKNAVTAWVYGSSSVATSTSSKFSYGELTLGRHQGLAADAVVVAAPLTSRKVSLIHSYVYQEFGFDPRTAWSSKSPLAARWGTSTVNADGETVAKANAGNRAGFSTRTRPYTAYDEFLVMSYYLNSGAISTSDVTASKVSSWTRIFSEFTTNPRGPGEIQATLSSDEQAAVDAIEYEEVEAEETEYGADTDGDGVPDGWELYVMSGPKDDGLFKIAGPGAAMSPTVDMGEDVDADDDGLVERREFAGTDSCAAYAGYAATVSTRPSADAQWLNKFFPTDPWNADTDGDGLDDLAERTAFSYGTPYDGVSGVGGEDSVAAFLTSIPGGGLNPCSVDTDGDGLPDGWEAQFAGTALVKPEDYVADGESTDDWYLCDTNGTVMSSCNTVAGYSDGMDGTVADAFSQVVTKETTDSTTTRTYVGGVAGMVDRDYDHDGLENWQEYLVGAMRCWRYDDPISPWVLPAYSDYFDENGALKPNLEAFGCNNLEEFLYQTAFNPSSPLYNPQFVTDTSSGAQYFTRLENPWDPAYSADGAFYIFPDRTGDSLHQDIWGEAAKAATGIEFVSTTTKYISCDPTKADTDQDGMDDYYELFHGLNPLLGESGVRIKTGLPCDIVYDALYSADAVAPSATYNYWTIKPWKTPRGNVKSYDFEVFPWLNGLATADPDGDDIRNQDEALLPKLSAAGAHTDPSPLWMTDSTYTNSLVSRFFRLPTRFTPVAITDDAGSPLMSFEYNGASYSVRDIPGFKVESNLLGDIPTVRKFLPDFWKLAASGRSNWMFSFEQNEGYDTDHDGHGDYDERAGKFTRSGSDPLDAESPTRRQAMYFQGSAAPSLLQALPTSPETYPQAAIAFANEYSFALFTAECWVCPETLDDATILERVVWTSASNPGDEEFLRRNFHLAVRSGKWYGCYDSNGTVDGNTSGVYSKEAATANAWTHLALTYDGRNLILYVNGVESGKAATSVTPESGSGALYFDEDQYFIGSDKHAYVALLVGASAKNYQDLSGMPYAMLHLDVLNGLGFGRYKNFYKGYVDEVRVWDGARTAAEVAGAVQTRYTADLIKANRAEIYDSWVKGYYRYATNGIPSGVSVPAELRYRYSFDSVPAAENANQVAKVPAGFGENGNKAPLSRPEGYSVTWWDFIVNGDGVVAPGYGSVYNDSSWVTWIPNTVAHLPRFDGTTLDSLYWSEDFQGDVQGSYSFAHTAEPVSLWTQMLRNEVEDSSEYITTSMRHRLVNGLESGDFHKLYRFSGRNRNTMGDDLLPLGGAFAKYVPASIGFWDGQGASSTTAVTGIDADNDGLPDWWQTYANSAYRWSGIPSGETVTWDTVVDYNGLKIPAWEAYLRDLAKGMYVDKDGNVQDGSGEYEQTVDTYHTGMPDWWTELYGIKGEGAFDDHDNDGLCNLIEYLLSERFDIRDADGNRKYFDPTVAKSVMTHDVDYFYPVGSLYVGGIFADHDFIEDTWERQYTADYVSPLVYDGKTDNDDDGWSAFAEARYAQQVSPIVANNKNHFDITSGLVRDYPIPAVQLTVSYSGSRAAEMEATSYGIWIGRDLTGAKTPDAMYWIKGSAVEDSSESGTDVTDTAEYKRVIGKWSNRRVMGTLTPGKIKANSIELQTVYEPSETVYSWRIRKAYDDDGYWIYGRGTKAEYEQALRKWGYDRVILLETTDAYKTLLNMSVRTDLNTEVATLSYGSADVGTVNLKTGEYDLNLGVFAGGYVQDADDTNDTTTVSLEDQTYRIVYQANPSTGVPRELYLGEADTGYVREGVNQVFVWADLDGDGAFTVGEPCGYARDVDIGWRTRALTVEVRDHSPIMPRVTIAASSSSSSGSSSLSSGSSSSSATMDRGKSIDGYCAELRDKIYDMDTTESMREQMLMMLEWVYTNRYSAASLDTTSTELTRVRIVRWAVDGIPIYRIATEPEVVLDQKILLSNRAFLTEADVLADSSSFDLDWAKLQSDVMDNIGVIHARCDVTNVAYLVVIGDGRVSWNSSSDTNSVPKILDRVIERRYSFERAATSPVNDNAVVYAGRPTLKWAIVGEDDSDYTGYTAFQLQILPPSGSGETPVWTSGTQLLPPRDSYGNYVYEVPAYVGDELEGGLNYRWRVCVLNAKFPTPTWSAALTPTGCFRMEPKTITGDYGTIRACVRYFGPKAQVLDRGTVRVEAFESPDFTGLPAARASLSSADEKTAIATSDSEHVCQVELQGLKAGVKYYVRAYIDSDTYGTKKTRDDWESWGYSCDRSGASADMFAPLAWQVDASTLGGLCTVYIEDTDINGNRIPDAYEMRVNGGTLDNGAQNLDETLHCGLAVKSSLVSGLNQVTTNASDYTGLIAHSVGVLQTRAMVALALGVPATAVSVDSSGQVQVLNQAESVEVTNISLADGKISLEVQTKSSASEVTAEAQSIYGDVTVSPVTVTVEVLRSETPNGDDWPTVYTTTLTISGTQTTTLDLDLPSDDTASSAFYKVRIRE